jgi:hypothetical protein
MTLIADISSGNTTLADWMFLIAIVAFGIAFITQWPSIRPKADEWFRLLIALGLTVVAIGWLVL